MANFRESNIIFHFDQKDWWVVKFDEDKYYRFLSGDGFRGVDFVCIWKKEKSFLIEVKNFTQYDKEPLPSPADLAEKCIQKFNDSLHLIRLAELLLKRKLMFKLFLPLIRSHPRRFQRWGFFTLFSKLVFEKKTYFVFLQEGLNTAYLTKLQKHFDQSPLRVLIIDDSNYSHSIPSGLNIDLNVF